MLEACWRHVGGYGVAFVRSAARNGAFQADATQQPRSTQHRLTQIIPAGDDKIKATKHVRPSVMS